MPAAAGSRATAIPTGLPRISDYPAIVAEVDPGRVAAILGDRSLNYGELARRIDESARAMLAHGITKGDRIAILSTPRPEYLVLLLAALRIGAIVVGLNPVHQTDEYRQVIADCEPRLLFAFGRSRGLDKLKALLALKQEFRCVETWVDLEPEEGRSFGVSLAAFLQAGTATTPAAYRAAVELVSPDDVALIVHTSGSTGRPKGAMITHGNLARCADIQLEMFRAAPLRALCNLPITHTACSSDIVAYTIAGGGTLIFQEQFDPRGVLALIEAQRVTFLLQVTAMYHSILKAHAGRAHDTSSLRYVFFLGAPLPRDMIADLMALGGKVITGWGLTESTTSVTFTEPGDDLDILAHSVGRPAPPHALRIVDEADNALPVGESGEVLVRGPCVMAGYYRQPAATAATMTADGWLRSGDLGRIDADGRLSLVGRIKDMFKSGGYNVYPREVEIVLESHPSIALAIVVAVPDPVYYEVGCAYLVCKPGCRVEEGDVVAFCRTRLANYKLPKYIRFREELPMLSIGKVDKVALRTEALRWRRAWEE
ncbi:MAG TPA: AMP-binding protein [Dongiaceae bacterium]|nr:AMP-binding protein [Dongiaceae bacterium]